VTKEVAIDSAEARLSAEPAPASTAVSHGRGRGQGRGGRGGLRGLSSVLGQLGKKSKLGTLEKSKLDWDRYKKDEGIEEELQTYNKGRDGWVNMCTWPHNYLKQLRTIQGASLIWPWPFHVEVYSVDSILTIHSDQMAVWHQAASLVDTGLGLFNI